MKNRKAILSLFSLLFGLVFLVGSTGLTVIIHSCHHCGDFSVHSGMFLSPEIPEDDCCESAINHCESHDSPSFVGECCHFKVDRLKLTNYTPSEKVAVSIPAEVPFTYSLPVTFSQSDKAAVPFTIHNKHGGRYLITHNCQFIS